MKHNKGFTLIEVVISIAALGVICAVLLRLFVLAADTNDITARRQAAEMAAASVAETLLCADTLGDGMETLGAIPGDSGGLYTLTSQGCDITLSTIPREENYPGVLYDIHVEVSSEGAVYAQLDTAKYYPEEAHD